MNINDTNAVSEIKSLALDMISQAKSGHPGICLSAAAILYTLYTYHMNIYPENPNWINRDRFVLSAGHGSALLYATLHLCGYPITKEDLKQFRSIDSKCPGYPELGITPGVDMSTGVLGEGIANAVGIALSERYLEKMIKKEEEQTLIDFRTYVLCSEGDLMNGISYEACSFAGTQKLDKLMILYDCNHVTNDGDTKNTFDEDIIIRFKAMGFYTAIVKEGMNIKSIHKAIAKAKKSGKPSFILFNTVLGAGSRNENKSIVYSEPLMQDDVFALKRNLNVTIAPFEVRKDTIIHVRKKIEDRIKNKYQTFAEVFNKSLISGNERLIQILQMLSTNDFKIPFDSLNYKVDTTYFEDILLSNHKVLNLVAGKSPLILGGSADLASTTKAFIDQSAILNFNQPNGRNINFGVRNHAMASILNGMATLGLKVYGSTTLVLSDYLKSSMRISAMLSLPVVYIFTHDSVRIGEDGPMHEPVEQLVSLRSIPNMITFRPCDITELFGIWEYICTHKKTISIVLGNQKMPKIQNTNSKLVSKGAYILRQEQSRLDGILLATGAELIQAIQIQEDLRQENLDIRVVSMVSQELFLKEDKLYQAQILPKGKKVVVLEPSSKIGWNQFVQNEKYIVGIDDFGYSGHSEEVLKKVGYDYESIKIKISRLFLSE